MRKKHVFRSHEVYHQFFHNVQEIEYCNNGSNMSWVLDKDKDGIFYSYSTPIGIAITKKKIIFIRGGTRSNTTSSHQSSLFGAVPPDWYKVFLNEWNFPPHYSGGYFSKGKHLKKALIEITILQLKSSKSALHSGTKYFGNPEYWTSKYMQLKADCKKLQCLSLLRKYQKKIDATKWIEEELKIHKVKIWALKEGIKGSYKFKLSLYDNPEKFQTYKENETERLQKETIAKRKRLESAFNKQLEEANRLLEKWYDGSNVSLYNHYLDLESFIESKSRNYRYRYYAYELPVYLRIARGFVNTSKGVNIPIEEAKRLYKFFKVCVRNGVEWIKNGEKYKIAHQYDLNRISKGVRGWYLVAGCHTIYEQEIDEFVKRFVPEWKNQEK